jgi:D-alanine--poly(phosphoribitol) ligase subunit 2
MELTADISARIERIFVERLHVEVSASTDLFEEGLLDSLAFIQLLADLELEFGIEIPVDGIEIESFRTVERIGDAVAALQSPSHGDSQEAARVGTA